MAVLEHEHRWTDPEYPTTLYRRLALGSEEMTVVGQIRGFCTDLACTAAREWHGEKIFDINDFTFIEKGLLLPPQQT